MSDDLAFISLTQNSVSEQQHQYEYTRDVQNIKLKAEKKHFQITFLISCQENSTFG